jgi:succinyl-CoA synthetase beta subunit
MLQESRAKGILRANGVPVPDGYLVHRTEELNESFFPVIVKAQVPVGGRGKAGGIKEAHDLAEAVKATRSILGMSISGHIVRSILIERKVPAVRELYISFTIDRSTRLPMMMATGKGGMEVESLSSGDFAHWPIHPFIGVPDHMVREVSEFLDLDPVKMGRILGPLWRTFWNLDCELLEINPLLLTGSGELVAADAKMTINDDALFRHPELGTEEEDLTPLEREAKERHIAFIQLDGTIGVIANGAGLTMATLDEIVMHGGKGGAFLDLGGTDDPAKVGEAFELMVKAGPRVILLNIFGGITKCDTVAEGVVLAVSKHAVLIPIIARIRGVNEDKARDILNAAGIEALTGLDEAALRAVQRGEGV